VEKRGVILPEPFSFSFLSRKNEGKEGGKKKTSLPSPLFSLLSILGGHTSSIGKRDFKGGGWAQWGKLVPASISRKSFFCKIYKHCDNMGLE